MTRAVSTLGSLGGIAGVIAFAPLVYDSTKAHVADFLTAAWGASLAPMLTGMIGVVECVAIFVLIKLLIVGLGTSALLALAAHRFPVAYLWSHLTRVLAAALLLLALSSFSNGDARLGLLLGSLGLGGLCSGARRDQ